MDRHKILIVDDIVELLTRNPRYYALVTENPENSDLYWHSFFTLSTVCIYVCAVIVAGSYIFYRFKLSAPLKALTEGIEQIAVDNLDFLEDYVEVMNTIQKLEDTPVKIQTVPIDSFMKMLDDNIKMTAKEYGKDISVINEAGLQEIRGDISLIFRVLD